MKKPLTRKNLQVIEGGLRRELTHGRLRIVASPETSKPFEVEAVAVEEDTWLILSADPKITEPEAHPIRLMTDVINAIKEEVGNVRVQSGNPLRFLAIVHDVDCEPTWREEWVQSALINVFQEAEQRQLKAIALPLLGTRHGHLKATRFAELLAAALLGVELTHLKRLWLVASVKQNAALIERLQTLLSAS